MAGKKGKKGFFGGKAPAFGKSTESESPSESEESGSEESESEESGSESNPKEGSSSTASNPLALWAKRKRG